MEEEVLIMQAYLNFVQALINCDPPEAALQLLQENPQFCDYKMVQLLYALAQQVGTDPDYRQFMLEIAAVIRDGLIERVDCFLQGARISADSDFDQQVVYPYLEANQHLWDERLYDALEAFKPEYYADGDPESDVELGLITAYYSRLIHQSPHGSKDINVKIASLGYEIAMQVLTKKKIPQDWDVIQGYVDEVLDEH